MKLISAKPLVDDAHRGRYAVPAFNTNSANYEDAGMAKVNFGEGFRHDYVRHFADLTEHGEHLWHPWRIQQEVKNRLRETMKQLILALGAENKA